ncbi:MAG TPA: nicotinate phosphoribosyltransferase [bacterium]|nr:nicotinate phosphoribosyltransferase [bacterium]
MSSLIPRHTGLYTDFYELTMAQGYVLTGQENIPACFDYFFRENPFKGGYTVFAGLDDLLPVLEEFRYEPEDLDYLKEQGFEKRFLDHLKDFRFRGKIFSVREGEVVFPLEPVLRVHGTLLETQLVETLILNFLNFESLIATKAARMVFAAEGRKVVDFGFRRSQGLAGIQASRAAYIGGVTATSNVFSAREFGLSPSGTQAHSWIQSFPDELTAFRKFTEIYPERCTLLVDTYNTLDSGVPNAILVAKELEEKGHRLSGIRLDSGDLAYLSKHARGMLDAAGLHYVKIVASNQLDEYLIRSLLDQHAPINVFGVGTSLLTGQDQSALDGVYKLGVLGDRPTLKISENLSKTSLPGVKKVVRYTDPEGFFYADGILLEEERAVETIFHPVSPDKKSRIAHCFPESLLFKVMEEGRALARPTVKESAAYAKERLSKLSPERKRFENPHTYKVGLSAKLMGLRDNLLREFQGPEGKT